MTFNQLRIFSAVVAHLNVSRAADALHISQPSLSQQLRLLEKELGLKLYRKVPSGIEPTEEGKNFLRDAEPILLRVDNLKKKLSKQEEIEQAEPGNPSNSLSVGASYTPSATFLPLLLEAFYETRPHVQLTSHVDRSCVLEQYVLNSEVDLALVASPSYLPSLAYEPFRKMEIVAFVSPNHPWARRRALTMAELAGAPLVIIKRVESTGRGKVSDRLLKEMRSRGFSPNIFMQCDSPHAVKASVRRGAEVGILFLETIEIDIEAGALKALKIPELKMHSETFVVYHKNKSLSPPAQDFLALLREWAKRPA
jgi:LysR family transcriptional regulator, low CO2-responsive transcriptional regulator